MYATELKNLVLIRTIDRKYVFSCSKREEFIEYIELLLKK